MNNRFLRIYTGNGQGKTTAAFGVALRALCAGKSVFIGQFVKSMKYNETKLEHLFKHVEIHQFGKGCFINSVPTSDDRYAAHEALLLCNDALSSGKWDLVILDELTIALYYKLLEREDIERLLDCRHETAEVIITGRYAPQWLIDRADLVTEMNEVKHYYQQGVLSRNGFDC